MDRTENSSYVRVTSLTEHGCPTCNQLYTKWVVEANGLTSDSWRRVGEFYCENDAHRFAKILHLLVSRVKQDTKAFVGKVTN